MPLYEYECLACSHRFERIQKFSDPLVDVCPTCGGAVRKLLSSPAIQFKGSGFYITDYPRQGRQENKGGSADSSSSSKAESGDKSGEKKGEKGEAKSEKSSGSSESPPAAAPSKTDAGS